MRRAGVLLHPTSLPNGTFGPSARVFIDWLAKAGARLWQVLPLVPPGAGASPYSSQSAFALSPALIEASTDAVDVDAYVKAHPWVDDYALYMALKQTHGGAPFTAWPAPLREREPQAIAAVKKELAPVCRMHASLQAQAEQQWQALRAYAKSKGIAVIGDVPIYVDHDSVDVWCNRRAFQLDSAAMPTAVSGVPPDYFSETGQLWGNPLYDWTALAKDRHSFWVARMRRMFELYDVVRIDHFRAFAAYWSVPRGAKDARAGKWVPGPGRAVFDDIFAALGRVQVIAEDLGDIDADVHALRDAFAFPGMRILHFAFGGEPDNAYLPHNHRPTSVVYTGTHDNDTTNGWWAGLDDRTKDHVRRYYGIDAHDIAWDLIRSALMSVADTAVVPMQDLLALGTEARMNTPSAAAGNWGWRMKPGDLRADVAERLRGLIELSGRAEQSVAMARS